MNNRASSFFVHELERQRQITGKESGELTKRMLETEDPAEAYLLRKEIVRGLYGN